MKFVEQKFTFKPVPPASVAAAGPSGGGDRQGGPEVREWSLHLLRRLGSDAAIFR